MSFDFKSRMTRSSGKLLAAALTVLCLGAPAMAAQQVVINGSTTVLPVVQKAGEAFMASHPGTELSISGGGSGNGIKALLEKQCDIAMSSRDIKDKEVEAAAKNGVTVLNAPGTVDADYRGEIKAILINHGKAPFVIERGMRIAQMVVAAYSRVTWEHVESLNETARGTGGFGSTGVKM